MKNTQKKVIKGNCPECQFEPAQGHSHICLRGKEATFVFLDSFKEDLIQILEDIILLLK